MLRLILLGFSVFSMASFAGGFIHEIPQALSRGFVPQGFDTDDSIEVMVGGAFKSTCFKIGDVFTEVSDTTIRIQVNAYEYSGTCANIAIPFYQNVHLGRIREAGDYTILDGTTGRHLGTLRVLPSTGQPGHGTDNVIYAPLTDAYLLTNVGKPHLALMGEFTNSCMGFKSLKMEVYGDVLVVLPQVGIARRADCKHGHFPFHRAFALTRSLPPGTFMLHVRSATGRAVNKIIVGN